LDRLFTCFVSSTFLDLQEERQRLVRVLLSNECVPLGMEFFPSAGRSQWPIIQDSITAADFCIFIVAGRYGSMSDQPPLSWTRREFREAKERGKPIAAMLHADPSSLPFDRCEPDLRAREQLAEFRAELEAHTVCKYFHNEADLVETVTATVSGRVGDGVNVQSISSTSYTRSKFDSSARSASDPRRNVRRSTATRLH
jgi:Domain of unknown function (DUF4062)